MLAAESEPHVVGIALQVDLDAHERDVEALALHDVAVEDLDDSAVQNKDVVVEHELGRHLTSPVCIVRTRHGTAVQARTRAGTRAGAGAASGDPEILGFAQVGPVSHGRDRNAACLGG
jgi:hypothetical protein